MHMLSPRDELGCHQQAWLHFCPSGAAMGQHSHRCSHWSHLSVSTAMGRGLPVTKPSTPQYCLLMTQEHLPALTDTVSHTVAMQA